MHSEDQERDHLSPPRFGLDPPTPLPKVHLPGGTAPRKHKHSMSTVARAPVPAARGTTTLAAR